MYTIYCTIIVKKNGSWYISNHYYYIIHFLGIRFFLLIYLTCIFMLYCVAHCLSFSYFIFFDVVCVRFVTSFLVFFVLFVWALALLFFLLMTLLLDFNSKNPSFQPQKNSSIIPRYSIISIFLLSEIVMMQHKYLYIIL